jgi:hypothetical protein
MAIPYNSVANQPQGLESVTINLISYVVDSVDLSSKENRIISRTDANGDRADFMIREGGDQITGSMTLQRALDSTVLPAEGEEFTYDFDRSGTASTLVVSSVSVNRGKDDFDTFDIGVVLVTYQA